MVEKIVARFIIQIAGKPVENVDRALKLVLSKIKEDKAFKVIESHIGEPELEDETTLYAGFLEVVIKFAEFNKILDFILDYTPSSIEVEEPSEITFDAPDLTAVLNDMSSAILKSVNQVRNLNAHVHILNKKVKELEGRKK